jgi:hypothetical protein
MKLLAKYFAMNFLAVGPLNPSIQEDFDNSCSPKLGGWGASEGDFSTKLLPIMDFAIGINNGGFLGYPVPLRIERLGGDKSYR